LASPQGPRHHGTRRHPGAAVSVTAWSCSGRSWRSSWRPASRLWHLGTGGHRPLRRRQVLRRRDQLLRQVVSRVVLFL